VRLLKLAFRLSVLANIVLVFWVLRERTEKLKEEEQLQELIEMTQGGNAALGEMNEDLDKLHQSMRDSTLQLIASNDQQEAFIEEHQKYVR
jgi:hypothetical protein